MVKKVEKNHSQVVKCSDDPVERPATAKGGLALWELLGKRTRVWSDIEKFVPARRCRSQGYSSGAVVSSTIYGLLSGGEGFACTEPLRGDKPLGQLVGLSSFPSAETVEGVMKYQAEAGGHEGVCEVLARQCSRLIDRERRNEFLDADGLACLWGDGSLLEVEGKDFEAIKTIGGKRGQLFSALFVGEYLLACDMADEKECELVQVRDFLVHRGKKFIESHGLASETAILLDSLYGDGPTLSLLEAEFPRSRHIVGANKLAQTDTQLKQVTEVEWIDTTARTRKWGWSESAVCTTYVQCEDWDRKRLCVGRRWKVKGEMLYRYSGVFTDFARDDVRLHSRMKRLKLACWEEAVWSLYGHKQGRENQWKDVLIDMGLHHPPSAKVQANAVFYAIAAVAYNLSVGVRRLALEGEGQRMRVWRLRRDLIDMAGYVVTRAREAVVHLLDARDHLVNQLRAAMHRLATL